MDMGFIPAGCRADNSNTPESLTGIWLVTGEGKRSIKFKEVHHGRSV